MAPDINIHNFSSSTEPGNRVGPAVSDGNEETRGAFAVANLNNTNASAKRDDLEAPVRAADHSPSSLGRDEVDLMALTIPKPTPNMGGSVTITITAGSAAIWASSRKDGFYPSPEEIKTSLSLDLKQASAATSFVVFRWQTLSGPTRLGGGGRRIARASSGLVSASAAVGG